jgi:hypothetical protein
MADLALASDAQPAATKYVHASSVTASPSVTCDNIVQALMEYHKSRVDQDAAENHIFEDTAAVYSSWYDHYSSYEGETRYIPYGTFRGMATSANTANRNALLISKDKVALLNKLTEILTVLKSCVK